MKRVYSGITGEQVRLYLEDQDENQAMCGAVAVFMDDLVRQTYDPYVAPSDASNLNFRFTVASNMLDRLLDDDRRLNGIAEIQTAYEALIHYRETYAAALADTSLFMQLVSQFGNVDEVLENAYIGEQLLDPARTPIIII